MYYIIIVTTVYFLLQSEMYLNFLDSGRINLKTQLPMRSARWAILLISLLLALPVEAAAPDSGVIMSLTASGGSNPGDIITISTVLQANGKIQNSNVYFEIIAPDGTVVDTYLISSMPAMNNNDTFSDSWTSDTSFYPVEGTYSVSICWSVGNARNCNIAGATSTFYAADTLGVMLFVAFAILGGWLWHSRRSVFSHIELSR
jgi:hypothetical protein